MKDALERFLPACFALYFPEAYALIDWARGFTFLDKELQRIRPRGAAGRRVVDKLVQVYLKDGGEAWVLVHIEVQGRPEEAFTGRMFAYYYRIHDKHGRPVASFGILTDAKADWRPSLYRQELLGCTVSLEFSVVKLLDFGRRWQELEASDNPFAVLTMAHLLAQETAKDPTGRLAAKLRTVRRLRDIGLSQTDREELFRLLDWLVALPEPLQLEFDEELTRDEEEGKMPFTSSIERRAEERGRQEGRQEGQIALLLRQIERKFGPLPEPELRRVMEADAQTIAAWGDRILTAGRLSEVLN